MRIDFLLAAVFAAAAVAAQEPSAAITLSPALAAWRSEIEASGERVVALVRVYTDGERNLLILPQDAEHRPVLRRYFLQSSFIAEFTATHGFTLNYEGPEGRIHFILLNMNRAEEWRGAEDGILAHELGHVWLAARGYPLPPFDASPRACLLIHAGDMVQHILIRQEIRRRGISYLNYWLPNLEKALRQLESEPLQAPAPACLLLAKLALRVDVALGLEDGEWQPRKSFLNAMTRRYPQLQSPAEQIGVRLAGQDLADLAVYRRELGWVIKKLEAVAGGWFPRP